jgi:hypothetical protein
MQNQILHSAQHTRTPAQLIRRIGTWHTAGKPFLHRFWGTMGILSFSYRAENDAIRRRIKFCIQHNKLGHQHNWLGESKHRILLGKPFLDRFLGTIGFVSFSYRAENGTIRCRIKFCTQHSTLKHQHNSLGESGQVILENASWNRSFGPIDILLLSYRSENDIIRRRIKFCIQHNTLEQQHNSLGESGQGIVLENSFYIGFWELLMFYGFVVEVKMISLDVE